MKKTLCIILALMMVVSLLAGCGDTAPADPAAPAEPAEPANQNENSASNVLENIEVDTNTSVVLPEGYEWPELTIVVNDYNPMNSGPAIGTQLACDHIEEVSGGKIKCEVYYGGTLIESTDSFAGTAEGLADITYYIYTLNSGVSTLHNLFCGMYTREMPDVLGIFECINSTLDAVPEFREEFAKQGLYELACGPTTGSVFEFNDAELGMSVKTPSDLAGHLIQASGYNIEAWAAYGVSGMSMGPADWYSNLERGVCDALSMNLPGVNDFGLTDVTNCYLTFGDTYNGLYNSAAGYFANLEKWNSWDPQVQALVKEGFYLGAKATAEADAVRAISTLDSEIAAGKKVNTIAPEDMGPWYEMAQVAYEAWAEDVAKLGYDPEALYNGYMEVVDAYMANNG